MRVHVCVYEHRHGTDVSVHRRGCEALAAKAGIAREWWEEACAIDGTLPELPPADDEAAAALYFEAQEGFELHQIRPCELQGMGLRTRLASLRRAIGRRRCEEGFSAPCGDGTEPGPGARSGG